jgi:DNA-binding transcriptional MocR family regulator
MNKTEKKAYEQLKSEGYLVEKPRRSKWQPQDFFYCWDFIAIKGTLIRFIQVSSKYLSQRTREDQDRMRNFPKPGSTSKEYWRFDRKKKEFIIEIL